MPNKYIAPWGLMAQLTSLVKTRGFPKANFQMNEIEIASRASNLRQQAICQLNGVEYKESTIANPKPSVVDHELKSKVWLRSDIDYQTLIVMVAAFMVIFNGYSFYVSEAQRDYLLATTSSRCISGVTIKRSAGKSPAPYFNDAQGQKVASCFKFRCSYNGWYRDVGKAANICLSGDVVVSIETGGDIKITRDSLIVALDSSIWWSKFWVGLGGICLAIFAFLMRNKWMESIRSRFGSLR